MLLLISDFIFLSKYIHLVYIGMTVAHRFYKYVFFITY